MNTLPPYRPESYSAIRFAVAHRNTIIWGATLTMVVLGLYGTLRTQQFDWVVLGGIAAVLVNLVVRLVMDLVILIADMLLPK